MRNFLYVISISAIIILGCLNVQIVTAGCRSGIELWYHSIVPVLLPFILLTGLIINFISSRHISPVCAYIIIFFIGMLCGFPTGTMIISHFYEKGVINRQCAQLFLPVCNNVSCMFLYGYIYTEHMKNNLNFIALVFLMYIPQIFIALISFLSITIRGQFNTMHNSRNFDTLQCTDLISATNTSIHNPPVLTNDQPNTGVIDKAIRSITVIGIYMVIFSIFTKFICLYFPGTCTSIFTSFMEISQGLPQIADSALPEGTKTALMISLSSFGGLSAIFQSHDMIKSSGLSFSRYIISKSACGLLCYIITYITMH